MLLHKEGPLTVTGVAVDAAGGAVEIGVPTSGRIPNGAIVELIPSSFETTENIILNLRDSDFSTSTAIASVH